MIKIICLGDSITEGKDIEKGFRWASLAANALGLEILNCGIGGDTTQGMLARFYPEVVSRKPAFVLILGGTNDLWWGAEINTILANIFSIVCQARYHDITPIIGLPLPIHLPFVQQQAYAPPLGGYEQFLAKLDNLVACLAPVASDSEVPVVDFNRDFRLANGAADDSLFLDDGLHPNRTGQAKIAATLVSQMRSVFHF
jgi:lysophospholipase L1-like esterase